MAWSHQHWPEESLSPQTFHYHPQKPQAHPLLCRGDGSAGQGAGPCLPGQDAHPPLFSSDLQGLLHPLILLWSSGAAGC